MIVFAADRVILRAKRRGIVMLMLWIVAGIALVVVAYLVVIYNRLVRLRALVREGWSGITVQLRRRADLVPNLVSTVEGYATHERELLEQVTARRGEAVTAKGVAATAQADAAFTGVLGKLVAVAEAYPDLKADANFRQLQTDLAEIEEQLAGARRYYNATVRDLNTAVQSFPDVLVAGPMGFHGEDFYTDDVATLQIAPQVRFGGARA
jgi:LemA protein